jgi:hypothetical protein
LQGGRTIDEPVYKIQLYPKTKIMAVHLNMLGTNKLKTEEWHVT